MAESETRKGGRRGLLRRLLKWPLRILGYGMLAALAWVAIYKVIDPPIDYYMGREWFRLGHIDHRWRDMDRIAPDLALSVMAAEDSGFCDHWGFDFEAIQKALMHNERSRRLHGASTISQQTAKNVFLWQGRSWLRKGLEAGFTVLIEAIWGKHRILEVYLNSVEFGTGIFGAEAAARHYYGRPAAKLTLEQSARLAAILPDPKHRDPRQNTAYMSDRAAAIVEGVRTLRAEGRAACVLGRGAAAG